MVLRAIKIIVVFLLFSVCGINKAQTDKPWYGKEREIRYKPEGTDFVTTNGKLRFNRALYGSNTAFRVEAGDLPEFAMYLPGMGGNLKFGLIHPKGSKWLIDAQNITALYRPGSMLYTISDAVLDKGSIRITVLALYDSEGVIVKVDPVDVPANVQLLWAFGGVTGKKFSRDGDLGADPESSFYLKPEYCSDNEYRISGNNFQVYYGSGRDKSEAERYENNYKPTAEELEATRLRNRKYLSGVFPPDAKLKISDANQQASPKDLYNSTATPNPLISGTVNLSKQPVWFQVGIPSGKETLNYGELPVLFSKAESQRKTLAERIRISTPDPYINAVGGALGIAADAVWEDPSFLHGANAWRMRLPGWRGAYIADALAWHDRAKMHFTEYVKAQYIEPDSGPNVPDPKANLARQEEKMGNSIFTKGYVSRNPGKISNPHHYDMNLVFFDQMLRHFDWTGDTAFLREMWPAIKLHLAWEKRCFDGNNDGLYDAYCCIWASDALQYSGGGVAHSSAYNYFSNKKAALLAEVLGEDPKPFHDEAFRILTAMNRNLWLTEKGWFAEYKDLLGFQKVHKSAALWTVYHTIDSEVTDPFQAYQMLRYVDTQIPHIPVIAKGMEKGYYTLSTTNWQPYAWSINNVASGEVFHTALSYWQAGRNDEAFRIAKSSLLDYLYMGSSPGNFGQLSFYDAFRGELYRDFADGIGMVSRSIIEGLYGIRPDKMNNRLLITPGFPSDWDSASLTTPDIAFHFKRNKLADSYSIESGYFKNQKLILRLKARQVEVKSVIVNGKPAKWSLSKNAVGFPEIEVECLPTAHYRITVEWEGGNPEKVQVPQFVAKGEDIQLKSVQADILEVKDFQYLLGNPVVSSKRLSAGIKGEYGHRSAFIKLRQGQMEWWQPVDVEVRPTVEIIQNQAYSGDGLSFTVRNNSSKPLKETLKFGNFSHNLQLEARSQSNEIEVGTQYLIPGTNIVSVSVNNQEYSQKLIHWMVSSKPGTNYETINLTSSFNDRVTNIFKNQYLSPRSPYPTLAIPTQGIGDWCSFKETEEIDDSGLRAKAGNANRITIPQGIPFGTPGTKDTPNIVFTSQWDNYPKETSVRLTGKASHVYLLMAGSTHHMQSHFDQGEVQVVYADGTSEVLTLRNPENWWPIEQDYYNDGFAFRAGIRPIRIHLKTGEANTESYPVRNKNKTNKIHGGAATVLDLPLDESKELNKLIFKTFANDVVIGLMAVTLQR